MHWSISLGYTLPLQSNTKTCVLAASQETKRTVTLVQWLQAHPPFTGYDPDRLVSLSTGIVADASVNCDNAVDIGLAAASGMDGKKFTDVTLRRKDTVSTIGGKNNTVKVRGQNTEVNPSLLFNRIMCVLNNSSEMEAFFAYELAPQPPSLFHDGVMRKPTKSALGALLKGFVTQQSNMAEKCLFVLDGGHLLQTVVWSTPSTYGDVCQSYISYTLKHYGAGSTVVFDGYGSATSTKVIEQRRRAQRCTSNDVIFDDNTTTTTSQAAFLANSHNKKRLIQAVREKMPMFGICVKQAEADADTLIISTALHVAESAEVTVVVIGTDTDLLVMLVARATSATNVYMLCRSNPTTLYNIHEIQRATGDTTKHLMFLHVMTGCDAVSAIYRQGKRKAFNLVYKKQDYDQLDTFTRAESTHEEVKKAGESFILKLYGASKFQSLDEYRHIAYKRATGRSSLSSSFQLESLPPTSGAAKQHSYRTYLTVQQWLGNTLPPTEWGWRSQDGTLEPVKTDPTLCSTWFHAGANLMAVATSLVVARNLDSFAPRSAVNA